MKHDRSFLGRTQVIATRLALAMVMMAILTATFGATAATPPTTLAAEMRQVRIDALEFRRARWIAASTAPSEAAEMRAIKLGAAAVRRALIEAGRTTPTGFQEVLALKGVVSDWVVPARNRPSVKRPPHICTCDPTPKRVLAARRDHSVFAGASATLTTDL